MRKYLRAPILIGLPVLMVLWATGAWALSGGVQTTFAAANQTIQPLATGTGMTDDAYSATSGTWLNVPDPGVLANDGGATNAALWMGIGAMHGSVTLNTGGGFSYKSATGYVGTDTFKYETSAGTAIVTITVSAASATSTSATTTTAPPATTPSTTGGTGGGGSVSLPSTCTGCHSLSGLQAGIQGAGKSAQYVVDKLTTGSMSGYASSAGMTTADIQALADFLAGTGGTGGGGGTTLPPPSLDTGAGVYAAFCSSCHGTDGLGGSSGEKVVGESYDEVWKVVRHGDGPMPAFDAATISDDQLDLLATFVSNGMKEPSGGGNGGGSPVVVPGSGEDLYNASCAGCHGLEGVGGIYEAVAGESFDEVVHVVLKGDGAMPSFAGVLTDAQIQAIAEYVSGLTEAGNDRGSDDSKSGDEVKKTTTTNTTTTTSHDDDSKNDDDHSGDKKKDDDGS